MFFLAVCLCGLISISRLKVQLLPDIEFSKLSIITTYENSAPSETEKLITRKIEEAITSVNGIQSIYSESMEGVSVVTAQFQWDTNMDVALIETKEKVDVIKSQLPQDAGKSVVVKFDPKSDPVLLFAVVSKNSNSGNMRHRIEKEIIPFIERIDGVAVVDVSGGLRKQINVNLDAGRLYAYGLTVDEVMQSIAASNHSFPAGYVRNGEMEYLVRTSGEFENFRDIRDVVVGKSDKGVPIVLESVADVDDGFKDVKCINKFNGKDTIGISIRKEPGKNVVDLSSAVCTEIDNIKAKYDDDFDIVKIYDQSDFVKNSISNVSREAVVGGLISILVLFFFLRELKAPLIIVSSIPISLLGTFSLMYFKGTSLNAMSLGGLAIGIGMIVDSGTIVIESIIESVGKKKHSDIIKPVLEGTRRITGPVFVSTMSNIIVFLPIVFISGLSGAVFGELALTITFSLLFAFLASVTLIPMLYTINYSKMATKFERFSFGKVHVARIKSYSERFIFKADLIYERFLGYALDNSRRIIKLGICITLIGFVLFLFIDFELMPKVNAGEFNIEIELPKGTSIENSSLFASHVESILLSKKYTKYVYSKIGSDPEENIVERTSGKSTNNVSIHVILNSSRFKKTSDIISELKKEIRASEDIKIEYNVKEDVISSILSQKQKALTVNIYGEEPELLKEYGAVLSEKLSSIEGVEGLVSS
ncbi:MAG: efflux RND transporter permease subunit, partial [Spirochaetes bacterium]|nr:efflux RND transporter permease subunit [Spirochaetota bacterium]